MANISNLDPLTPTGTDPVSGGDNQLRTLKNALVGDGTASNGSFTPGFTGQYTGTAAELNLVNTAAQPADGLSFFNEVDTSGAAAGAILEFDGTEWLASLPPAPGPPAGTANYSVRAGMVGARPYFSVVSNNIPASVATIANDALLGWVLTAVVDCDVDLNYSTSREATVNGSGTRGTIKMRGGIASFAGAPPSTVFDGALAYCVDSDGMQAPAPGVSIYATANPSAIIRLLAAQTLTVSREATSFNVTGGAETDQLSCRVVPV
jgi:hypothetical protein